MKKQITIILLLCISSVSAQFTTSGSNTTTTNNVGIGTGIPGSKLHVYRGASGGSPSNFSSITLEDSNWTMMTILTPSTRGGYYGFADEDDPYVAGMEYSHINNTMMFRVNNHIVSDLVIDGDGFVGIGTINPEQKLDVRGTISNGGADFLLGRHDDRAQGNNTRNRAMVHGFNDELIINYAGDFEGGVRIDGLVSTLNNVSIGGESLILGTNDLREQGQNTENRALVHGNSDELIINYAGDFEGGVEVNGTLSTSDHIITGGNVTVGGADLILGTNDYREQGENTKNRALVHGNSDELIINYAGDFEGGVEVNGAFSTSSDITTGGNVRVGGADLILGINDLREQGENTKNRALVHGTSDELIINYEGDFEGGVEVNGTLSTSNNIIASGNVTVGGADLVLGTNDLREQGENTRNRALVHGLSDELIINFQGDFEGGTIINGKVGIGTSDPKNELSVNGTIWAKKVRVRLTDAADWVFSDSYKLPSLTDVKAYIKEHKHLPEIPSAEEFRTHDMEVSEMTNKLLQKIEELTLYTIEQEEKLEVQAQKLQKMEVLEARLAKLEAVLPQK